MKIIVNVVVVKAVLMDMAGFVTGVMAFPLALVLVAVKVVACGVTEVVMGVVRVLDRVREKYSGVMLLLMSERQRRFWDNFCERVF